MSALRRATAPLLATCAVLALGGCVSHQPAQISGDRPSLKAAREALAAGSAGTSLAIARGVLSSLPDNVPALTQAGDAEVALEDHIAAEADYKHALALSPSDVHARLGLGKLQMQRDAGAAEATFRTVLATAPRNPAVLTDLGVSLDLQGRHAEAQTNYAAAMTADPNLASARVDMALSMALSGQPERAEEMLRDATFTSGSTPRVRADFAIAQVIAGHDNDAVETLRTDLTPDEAKATIDGLQSLKPIKPHASN